MSTIADKAPAVSADPPLLPSELSAQWRAEAANYAVLRRIAPALRHDVAGLMQPLGMLMMVLQRRMQMPDPDLAAISKNVASVNALTKEATAGCMNAMGWMVTGDDAPTALRTAVNEAIKLLEMEFAATALELVNGIADDQAVAPKNFLHSVLTGALLAFCDQRTAGAALEIKFEAGSRDERPRLKLCMLPGDASKLSAPTEMTRPSRAIDWSDVEAMANSFNVTMARGEGWLTLSLPVTG